MKGIDCGCHGALSLVAEARALIIMLQEGHPMVVTRNVQCNLKFINRMGKDPFFPCTARNTGRITAQGYCARSVLVTHAIAAFTAHIAASSYAV